MQALKQSEVLGRFINLPRDQKILLFLGAGCGYSVRLPLELRLPLGDDIKRELLKKAYSQEDLSDKEREDRFSKDYKTIIVSPDMVWERLISLPGRLKMYYPTLAQLFHAENPVPAAYYMVARWFFTVAATGGVVTTNFDEKLDTAFNSVAISLGLRYGVNFHIASVIEDFKYVKEYKISTDKLIQKLHGTFSQPWSIRAGLQLQDNNLKSRKTRNVYPPYELLVKAIDNCEVIIFLGYSFRDIQLFDSIIEALTQKRSMTVIVVDHNPDSQKLQEFQNRIRDNAEILIEKCDAESFLRNWLDYLMQEQPSPQACLPPPEKRILQDGRGHRMPNISP